MMAAKGLPSGSRRNMGSLLAQGSVSLLPVLLFLLGLELTDTYKLLSLATSGKPGEFEEVSGPAH